MVLPFLRGRPLLATAVTALLLVAPAGCGGASQEALDDAARSNLRADVASIREAVRNPVAATAAVARFRSDVRRLMDDDKLDPADGLVLLTQVAQIEAKIRAEAPTPTPTPPPKPAAIPGPSNDEDDDERDGRGKGKDKKKGGKGD